MLAKATWLVAALAAASGWQPRPQLDVSSRAFDSLAGGNCSTPSETAAAPVTGKSVAASCRPTFDWVVQSSSGRLVNARLDVQGEGIPHGWVLQLDFGLSSAPALGAMVGAHLISSIEGTVLLMPRLASGIGTMQLALTYETPSQGPRAAPTLTCVPEPRPGGGEDERAWVARAREDYLWMAKEFNRQYINSHGKESDDHQPHSADSERQLHYLNGRLWCFFGSVDNATRSLEESVRLDRHFVLAHILLAKIFIGQGYHARALAALDTASALQPTHWQTHLLRLHVLRRLGKLHSDVARRSHEIVCFNVAEACAQARMREVEAHICEGGRVRLGGGAGDGGDAFRGFYGEHLHSAAARGKLERDRYVVLRDLLPTPVLRLLQAWYRHLRRTVASTAIFQQKTQRHEYLPEILSTYLNLALVPFASKMTGTPVAPTYPFPITYVPGGQIHPHLDVTDNELSITYQVELEGATSWPLAFIDPRGQQLSALDASTAKEVTLDNNGGVLYYGPDIVHWRPPQLSTLTQIVFAFREEDPTHCNNQ